MPVQHGGDFDPVWSNESMYEKRRGETSDLGSQVSQMENTVLCLKVAQSL